MANTFRPTLCRLELMAMIGLASLGISGCRDKYVEPQATPIAITQSAEITLPSTAGAYEMTYTNNKGKRVTEAGNTCLNNTYSNSTYSKFPSKFKLTYVGKDGKVEVIEGSTFDSSQTNQGAQN